MVISSEIFERLLTDSIVSKNEHQFTFIVNDLKVDVNANQRCFNNLSIFEKVLSTPKSQKFIELCLQNGSSFFKKNADNVYPIKYAIDSLCLQNLTALLSPTKMENSFTKIAIDEDSLSGKSTNIMGSPTSCNDDVVHHQMIVNEKFESGNNYLHILINQLTDENYGDVSEMVKLMLVNKCNANVPNDRLETPFYLLLTKLRSDLVNVKSDLGEFFIDNANVDFYSYRSDEIINMTEELDLRHRIEPRAKEPIRDVKFMSHLLEEWNEKKFVDEFEPFVKQTKDASNLQDDLVILLEAAIARNFKDAVQLLLSFGADVNGIPKESKCQMAPPFLATRFGHHEILKLLLENSQLNFNSGKQTLLHQACLPGRTHANDRQKCFDLIIADHRCNAEIINGAEDGNSVPLFYACHYGFDEIAKELLRRGAFIGHESVINNIRKEVLEEFLDECIKYSNDVGDRNCEIHIDYRFLTPCIIADNKSHLEVQSVYWIATNSKLKDLTLHVVIMSFLNIKWRKINWLVYFNLLTYFIFMIFLGLFIINFFHDPVYNEQSVAPEAPYWGQFNPGPDYFNFNDSNAVRNVSSSDADGDEDFLMSVGHDLDPQSWFPRHLPGSSSGGSWASSSGGDGGGGGNQLSPGLSSGDPAPGPSFEEPRSFSVESVEPEKPGAFDIILTLFGLKSRAKRSKRSTDTVVPNKLDAYLLENRASYLVCLFGVFLMIFSEVVQFLRSYKKYFFKVSNWFDILLISLSITVLLFNSSIDTKHFKNIRALTVLVMAAQTIQLVARVPLLSMSLHMAMFQRVCVTFLKTIALYLILISAFAMSFYTLNNKGVTSESSKPNPYFYGGYTQGDETGFSSMFMSVITIFRMMLSDFGKINIRSKDHFQGFMFLLFAILITVILLNLLNSLAISDTQKIMEQSEMVNTQKRISTLNSYEKLFATLKLSFANILPSFSTITLKPNQITCNQIITSNAALNYCPKKLFKTTMDEKNLKNIVAFVKRAQQESK